MVWNSIGLVVGLALTTYLQAQSGWEYVRQQDEGASWMLHGVEVASGDIYVTVREQGVAAIGEDRAHVLHLDGEGEEINETQLDWEAHVVSTSRILFAGQDNSLNVIGAIRDPEPQDTNHTTCAAFFKFDEGLNLLDSRSYGICGPQYGYMCATQGIENAIVVGYTIMQPSGIGEQRLHTLKLNLSGDSLTGHHLMTIEGWGSADAITPHPMGGYVMMVDGFDLFGLNGVGYAVYLDSEGEPIAGHRLEPMGEEPHIFFDFPGNPLDVLPLENGELIVSGVYWRTLENRGPLVRRVDSTGYTLAQWESDSPYHNDDPPLIQGLDRTPNGRILFAQSENSAGFWSPIAPVLEPTRVRLLQLDTALTVLAEYVMDGFIENKYYHLASVIAAEDGGAFLLGAITDLNEPDGRPDAWIRRIGPDEFVTISEYDRSQAVLFPNPGSASFEVRLPEPVSDAHLMLTDAQGRLVYSVQATGSIFHVPTGELRKGMYFLRMISSRGEMVFANRWVKQ